MNLGEGAREGTVDPMDAYQRLQGANPVSEARLPDASSPQARALFEEVTMSTPPSSPQRSTTRRTVVVAAAAVFAVIAVIAGATLGGWFTSPEPAPVADGSQEPVSPGGLAMCVEQYSLESLAGRDFAFEGTVTAIEGDEITFDVREVFTGDLSATATLGGATVVAANDSLSSVPGPGLAVGDRALVAGDDRFAWGCGFTQPYDPAVADQWREALS